MKNYSGASKTFSFVQLMILMIVPLKCQNIFCNANFQSYVLTNIFSSSYTIQFRKFPSDSCWHFQGENLMEIQKPNYAPYTKMAELSVDGPNYYLCQNSSLTIKKLYNFTFQYLMHFDMQSTTVNFTINNIMIQQKTSLITELYPNLGTLTYIFVANQTQNQFCVGSQETWRTPRGGSATLLDNFQLKLIPNQPKNMLFQYFYSFRSGFLFLSSSNETNESYKQFFNQNAILQFNGIPYQNISFQLNANQSLTMNQSIPTYSNTSSITMNFLNSFRINNCLYDLTITFEHLEDQLPIIITDPDHEQEQGTQITNQYQYEIIDKIQNSLYSLFFKYLPHIRLFGGTYLFQNIITFYNILVLYNFMNLPLQPKQSHQKLQNLAQLYFSDEQILLKFFQNIFENSFLTIIHNKMNEFLSIHIETQKIEKTKQKYTWFGTLGLTSSFLNNNFVNILLIAFLILKFFIIFIIIKIISFCKPKFHKKSKALIKTFYSALAIELIICSPSMTISAMSLLLNTGSQTFISQINSLLQLIYFCIIIHLPALYFIMKYPQFYNKNIKSNFKVSYKLNLKLFWPEIISQMKLLLHILLPCIITISNNIAFSIITTLALFTLIFLYLKGYHFLSPYKKIFNLIFILFLTAYHVSFTIMFFTSYTNLQYLKTANQYCSFLGFFVVMTVIFGGIFEILECIIEFFLEIIIPAFKKILSFLIWKSHSPKKYTIKNMQKSQTKVLSLQLLPKRIIVQYQSKKFTISLKQNFLDQPQKQIFKSIKSLQTPIKVISPNQKNVKVITNFPFTDLFIIFISSTNLVFQNQQQHSFPISLIS